MIDRKELVYQLAVAACKAGVAYDNAIRDKATAAIGFGVDSEGKPVAISRGEDLDRLYMDWMSKVRAALAELRAMERAKK